VLGVDCEGFLVKLYAIYRELQEQFMGKFEYSTPGGGTVIATSVGPDPEFKDTLWPDKRYLGEVVRFVRRVTWPVRLS
jgi:hypothetical protein